MRSNYKSNIWKYYLFRILSVSELVGAVYILFLIANNMSMTQIMILESIFMFTILLLEVPSGAFADLFGRKLSITLSVFFNATGFIIVGLGHNFWQFLVAQLFIGIGWAMESGADTALVYDSLKEIKQEKNFYKIWGNSLFLLHLTLAITAIISSILAEFMDYRVLFFLSAAIFVIAGLVAITMREPPIHKKIEQKNYFKHIKNAIKFTNEHIIVKRAIIYYGTFAAITHLIWFIIPVFYENKGPLVLIGIALFIYFLFAGIGSILPEKIYSRISKNKLLYLLLLISGLSTLLIPYSLIYIGFLCIAIMSTVSGIRDVIISTLINKNTTSYNRATVCSIQSFTKGIMYTIFAPIFGLITDKISPEITFMTIGLFLLIFLIYFILSTILPKAVKQI